MQKIKEFFNMRVISLAFRNIRPLHITTDMLKNIFDNEQDAFYVEDTRYKKSEIVCIHNFVDFDIVGPKGVPGYFGYTGYWDPSDSYKKGDVVEYNWKIYTCKKDNLCEIPYNKEFWEEVIR